MKKSIRKKNYTNEKKFTNGTNEKYMSEKYMNETIIRIENSTE